MSSSPHRSRNGMKAISWLRETYETWGFVFGGFLASSQWPSSLCMFFLEKVHFLIILNKIKYKYVYIL